MEAGILKLANEESVGQEAAEAPLQEATPPTEMEGVDVAVTNGAQEAQLLPSKDGDRKSGGTTPTKGQLEEGVMALAPHTGDVSKGPEPSSAVSMAADALTGDGSDPAQGNVKPYVIPSESTVGPAHVSEDPPSNTTAKDLVNKVETAAAPQVKPTADGKRVCCWKFDGERQL